MNHQTANMLLSNGQIMVCSCDRNSDFFRDLILMEVSELNGIVGLLLDQFISCLARANVLSKFELDAD